MLDIHRIRSNPDEVKVALEHRKADFPLEELLKLDEEWREKKGKLDELRGRRNAISIDIGKVKKEGKDAAAKMAELADIPKKISNGEGELKALEVRMTDMLLAIPNIPHESVPVGGEEANKEIRKWGTPKKFDFNAKAHWELGEKLGMLDFERGAKLGGHRFAVMKGDLAKLERAITEFFLDVHTSRGYTEYWTPYLVNDKAMTGTGQLPKFAEELYHCERDNLWLIPTAEVPLTNMFADEILNEEELPKNMTAFTPCFRREAGAYGKDIKGMLRTTRQPHKKKKEALQHPRKTRQLLLSLCLCLSRCSLMLEASTRTGRRALKKKGMGIRKGKRAIPGFRRARIPP